MLFVVLLTGDQAPNQDGVPNVPQAQDKGALLSPSDPFPNLPSVIVFYPVPPIMDAFSDLLQRPKRGMG